MKMKIKIKDSLFRSILEFRAKRQRSVINKNINSNSATSRPKILKNLKRIECVISEYKGKGKNNFF